MSLVSLVKRGLLLCAIFFMPLLVPLHASDVDLEALLDDDFGETPEVMVSDPFESLNRVFFTFNDRLYFWVLKPVGKVYTAVLADEVVRGSIRAAFHNVLAPVRVANNLLQGKLKQSGTELARFAINTVLGAGGLGDPAAEEFGLEKANEDFGQTLGYYGVGEGVYICWPFFGPSSARDTVGMAGDYLLNPLFYIFVNAPEANVGLTALKAENAATLSGKDYEEHISQGFDPYIALRDIYYQHRRSQVSSTSSSGGQNEVNGKVISSHEQCADVRGNASFRNLAKARKYQHCLEETGVPVSVNRVSKKGRALYQVIVDDRIAMEQ